MIRPSRASTVDASTPQRLLASCTRASRAAAAPSRTAGTLEGVVRLPADMPSSGTWLVSAMSISIRSGATRSSSAAAWVSSARAPCPISIFPVNTVMRPSWAR